MINLGQSSADEIVLPYKSFGPQVLAHELIGMEWWQWDSHGDSKSGTYPIQVVVYWDQTLVQTEQKYPVQREKKRDFRYVERARAIEHLAANLKNLENQPEYLISEIVKVLRETLTKIRETELIQKKPLQDVPVTVHIHN